MSPCQRRPPARNWLAGCIVHSDLPIGAPEVAVKINGKPFRTLLDSNSAVSLVQPLILAPHGESKAVLPIICVHGDTRQVPARRVTISAAPGAWPVEAGLMKDLPVPVLLGRDWPGFDHLLAAATQPASPRGSHSFAKEQCKGDRLKHCWTQIRVIEGKEAQPGPHPLPHFIVQNGLLYCVAQQRGEEKLLLVVLHTKTETVLELAHSHPMAGHLGVENPVQRIRDRFHRPGLEAEAKRFCQACPTCQLTSPRKPPPVR
ncbi:Gypsy retrotransposon integrase-like protein 1 [Labeo rohita]|uniref:Gypsy retrotransposon integrase-like protein 1 n=1 Tax=Labeo rohita TaxID=84645 RepID=A0ABQ8L1V1_LABRO|nr:Gypsy retrotransposon integrase-like protein 1 [Labeo rohita]